MITMRALAAGSLVGLLLAGCSSGPEPGAPTTSPQAPSVVPLTTTPSTVPTASEPASTPTLATAACTLGDLRVGLAEAPGGGGMGSSYALLTFTNTSATTCTLYGYPGVSYVGKGDGTQIGAAAARDDRPRKVVRVEPSKRTTALLRMVQAANYGDACRLTDTDGLRVYPPGSQESAFVRAKGTGCANKAINVLEISPVGNAS